MAQGFKVASFKLLVIQLQGSRPRQHAVHTASLCVASFWLQGCNGMVARLQVEHARLQLLCCQAEVLRAARLQVASCKGERVPFHGRELRRQNAYCCTLQVAKHNCDTFTFRQPKLVAFLARQHLHQAIPTMSTTKRVPECCI
jgi:hypothetical protein